MTSLIVEGFAKVNLSLRVRPRDSSGYHPIRSLVQSIGWADRVSLRFADDEDGFTVDGDVTDEEDNLAWRAVNAVRMDAASRRPFLLHLEKRIAVAAGLGGGSADAAAGLVAASRLFRSADEVAFRLAPDLGSDVAFCLVGGTAWMQGRGEVVTGFPFEPDYAVAVAVPPFELSTAEVYRRWDELDGPSGAGFDGRQVPPSLREVDSLGNDLLPAAFDLRPELGEWMIELSARWERPVMLTGSGPAVFGFFNDEEEARAAVEAVQGSRAVWAGNVESVGTRVLGN